MKFIIEKSNRFLILFILIIISLGAYNLNCRIDFSIKGLENKQILFAYEYGNRQIVVDTIKLDSEGKGFYSSKSRLTGGIYIIVFPDNKYVEFLINDEQFFTINSDTSDLFNKLSIEGAEESELFRQYQVLANDYEHILKKSQSFNNKQDTSAGIPVKNKELEEIKNKLDKHIEKILIEKPKSYLALYLNMRKDPVMPENKANEPKAISRDYFLKRYSYTKFHYFDNIPFSDVRILRTRLVYEKLDYYLNHFITQEADSMISAINYLSNLGKVQEESYHFVLNMINFNYRNPKNPSQEKAFVYLADNYYLNGKVPWPDSRYIKLLKTKVEALRPTLLGNVAPNLELTTSTDKTISIHDILSEFLVVYFWSPDCSDCRTETQELYKVYEKYKNNGLKIIAIYAHADKEMWNAYLKEKKFDWINAYDPLLKSDFAKLYNLKSIPKILLLDKEKRIISKDINVSQLEVLLKTKIK
jgi:thiol-disulfide isomerase/thioredoxin